MKSNKDKKKNNNDSWEKNHSTAVCVETLSKKEQRKKKKQEKDEKWLEKHIPKPTKKEEKYAKEIEKLESIDEPTKKQEKRLKKLRKKHKQLYDYRHKAHSQSHSFRCCLTTSLILVVVVVTALIGGLVFAYNTYAKPYTGLSFLESTKVIFGLYGADEKEIVTHPFDTKKDSEAFFKGLQQSLYLEKQFTIDNILGLLTPENGGTGDGSQTVQDIIDQGNPPTNDNNTGGTGNSYLDALLKDAKFDFSSLKDYDGTQKTDFFITDKMIGALMQEIINSSSKVPALQEVEAKIHNPLNSVFAVKQCLIKVDGEENTTMSLTIQLNIKTFVSGLLTEENSIPDFAKKLIVGILPERIYFGATTTPKVESTPVLSINSIDDTLLQTLLNNIDKQTNGQINQILNKVGASIFNAFAKVDEMVGESTLEFLPSDVGEGGELQFDAIQAIMYTLDVKNVTSKDFLLMVKHLHTYDINGITPEDFIESLGNLSTIEDFNLSRDNLFGAYGISQEYAKDFTPVNFIDKAKELPSYINIKGYKDSAGVKLYDKTNESLQKDSIVTDSALGQIFNSVINTELASEKNKMPFSLEILEFTLDGKNISIIAKIDINDIINSAISDVDESLKSLISSLFPSQLYVKIITPYTRASEGVSSEIIFNYSKDETSSEYSDNMINTLSKIMQSFNSEIGNTFNKDYICKLLDDNVYKALDTLQNPSDNNPIKVTLQTGYAQLPTVYEILANSVNANESVESEKLKPIDIQTTLQGYYNYHENTKFEENAPVDNVVKVNLEGAGNMIERELEQKLFLNNAVDATTGQKPIRNDTIYSYLSSLGDKITAENIDSVMNTNLLKNNTAPAKEKQLTFASEEFAKLIMLSGYLDNVVNDFAFYNNFRVIDMQVADNVLNISMCGDLDKNYVINNPQIGNIKIDNLASDYIIIQTKIDLNNLDNHLEVDNSKLIINNIENTQSNSGIDNLFKIINNLSNSNEENKLTDDALINLLKENIKKVFDTFEAQNISFKATNDIGNGKNGFVGDNIYKIVANKLRPDEYVDGDDELLRAVIYKLNNLYKAEGDTTPFVSDHFDSMKDSSFDGYLPEIKQNGSTLNAIIYDTYIGKNIKKSVELDQNDNLVVTKFAILGKNSSTYDEFITRLNIAEINNFKTTDSLFMQFKINSALFGSNELANKFLPQELYAGIMVDFNDFTNTMQFINNLTQAEMSYLLKITAELNNDSPIDQNIQDVINKVLNINVTVDKVTLSISDIAKVATVQTTNKENCFSELAVPLN